MTDAKGWALEIDKAWAEEMGGLRAAVEYVALTAINRIDLRSPVKTGRFRANWTLSIGGPDYSVTEKTGTNVPANNAKAQTYPADGFPVLYLQNSLPYAERLENGYSAQAPAGMVALTYAELSAIWEATKI